MKIIVPLRVYAVATHLRRTDDTGIVQIAFGDDICQTPQTPRLRLKCAGQFLQDVKRAEIEDTVDRIQAQRINVVLREPVESVVYKEIPYAIASPAVVVDRRSPRSSIRIRKEWCEIREVIALWPQMVVNHVKHYGQSMPVAGIDQSL